jgi:hypothetical protein
MKYMKIERIVEKSSPVAKVPPELQPRFPEGELELKEPKEESSKQPRTLEDFDAESTYK